MTSAVLDASAVLALVRAEAGADKVVPHVRRAAVSAVNLQEVATLPCRKLRHASIVNSDETGVRIEGSNAYHRVFRCSQAVVHTAAPTRGAVVVRIIMDEHRPRRLVVLPLVVQLRLDPIGHGSAGVCDDLADCGGFQLSVM